jgi:hypothetical protein
MVRIRHNRRSSQSLSALITEQRGAQAEAEEAEAEEVLKEDTLIRELEGWREHCDDY